MPRHEYSGVSTETEAAVKPCVGEIANEMQVSDKYLYAILAGEKTDPFLPFKELFRAAARKNPDGARVYVARLSTMLREENPEQKSQPGLYDVTVAFNNVLALVAAREDGRCSVQEVEAAKQRFVEQFARYGTPEKRATVQFS
jgi:hypothetical protein